MYDNLHAIGINHPEAIERYALRQEVDNDILKVYFRKQPGELFAKSLKFKFPRQKKTVLVDSGTHEYKRVTEINTNLRYIVEELDQVTVKARQEADLKQKILADLYHLRKVVTNKIDQIEADLKRL